MCLSEWVMLAKTEIYRLNWEKKKFSLETLHFLLFYFLLFQIKYHKKRGNLFKLVITSTDITVVPAMETKKKKKTLLILQH